MPEDLKNERNRHEDALEFYYSLGLKRSLPQVAEQFGVSNDTAKLWSRSFKWAQRIKDRDAELAGDDYRALRREIFENKKQALETVRTGLEKMRDYFKREGDSEGKEYYTVSDFDKLLRIQNQLIGEERDPAENPDTGHDDLNAMGIEGLKEALATEIEKISEILGIEALRGVLPSSPAPAPPAARPPAEVELEPSRKLGDDPDPAISRDHKIAEILEARKPLPDRRLQANVA